MIHQSKALIQNLAKQTIGSIVVHTYLATYGMAGRHKLHNVSRYSHHAFDTFLNYYIDTENTNGSLGL